MLGCYLLQALLDLLIAPVAIPQGATLRAAAQPKDPTGPAFAQPALLPRTSLRGGAD